MLLKVGSVYAQVQGRQHPGDWMITACLVPCTQATRVRALNDFSACKTASWIRPTFDRVATATVLFVCFFPTSCVTYMKPSGAKLRTTKVNRYNFTSASTCRQNTNHCPGRSLVSVSSPRSIVYWSRLEPACDIETSWHFQSGHVSAPLPTTSIYPLSYLEWRPGRCLHPPCCRSWSSWLSTWTNSCLTQTLAVFSSSQLDLL